jgi:nitrogen regulatory protein P-II 2
MKPVKLVTIIALDSLEAKIVQDMDKLEIRGYTISPAHGKGLHSKKISDWEGTNIRIESLVSEEKGKKLVEMIRDKYLNKYGVVLFVSDVEVLRPERYS